MFFNLYGFEEYLLKYTVGMIDCLGQYSFISFAPLWITNFLFHKLIKKKKVMDLLRKGKKKHTLWCTAMLKKTHVVIPLVYKYITLYPTCELFIKRNFLLRLDQEHGWYLENIFFFTWKLSLVVPINKVKKLYIDSDDAVKVRKVKVGFHPKKYSES